MRAHCYSESRAQYSWCVGGPVLCFFAWLAGISEKIVRSTPLRDTCAMCVTSAECVYYDGRRSFACRAAGGNLNNSGCIPTQNEICRVCQASLLTFSVLLLSYQSIRHGCEEHSILENGQFVRGYIYKGAVNIGLGYTSTQALIATATALIHLFSVRSRKSYWSLPFIAFYFANLITDLANFLVFLWILFERVSLIPALFYAVTTLIAFLGRLWLWLGTLGLFEQRLCE